MLYLKQFMLLLVLRLFWSLFEVLGPIDNRLCIPNFDLRKDNFSFVTRACVYPIIVNSAENFIKIVRTLIVVKLKNIRYKEL